MGSKRFRASVVCTFCKKRKVKCDKGEPCSTCVKYGNSNCFYEFKGERNRIDIQDDSSSEIIALKERIRALEEILKRERDERSLQHLAVATNDASMYRGVNPVADPLEKINFYENYCPIQNNEPLRRLNSGPLCWISLMKSDKVLSCFWNFIKFHKRAIFKPDMDCPQEKQFVRQVEDSIKNEQFLNLNRNGVRGPVVMPNHKTTITEKQIKKNINEIATSFGLLFYKGPLDNALDLAQKIELVLPTRKVIWKLTDRFFSHIYPFYPFIDEISFIESISRIIGPRSMDQTKVEGLIIERDSDFAVLGVLLVLLRLSYVSLFPNITSYNESILCSIDDSPQIQEIKFLLGNPIDLEVIELAQECLNKFNLLRNINLGILQLSLYIRIYNSVAPEEGDGADGGDARIFTGLLLQMAIVLGLNREPDNYPEDFIEKRANNIGRKIWYFLLLQDLHNTMAIGLPLISRVDWFDTKLPYFDQGSQNIRNSDLEKQVVNCFIKIRYVYIILSDLLALVVSVKGDTTLYQLTNALSNMESNQILDFEDLRDFNNMSSLSHPQIIDKTISLKIYLQCKFFSISIYFHIFNFYERKRAYSFSYFYLRKTLYILVAQLIPFYDELLASSHVIFKNSTDLILTPAFEQVIHRSAVVIYSLILRLRFSILYYEENSFSDENPKLLDKLKELYSLLQRALCILQNLISKLSTRYYYAWKIYRGICFFLKMLRNGTFFEDQKYSVLICPTAFSVENLCELIGVFQVTFDGMEGKTTKNDAGTYNSDLESFADADKVASSNPATDNNFSNNSQITDIDNIWLQMLSLKGEENNDINKTTQPESFRAEEQSMPRYDLFVDFANQDHVFDTNLSHESHIYSELFKSYE